MDVRVNRVGDGDESKRERWLEMEMRMSGK